MLEPQEHLAHFHIDDLADLEHGQSYYKGVLIIWDEDHDERVIKFIDKLSDNEKSCMIAVHEHKGYVDIMCHPPHCAFSNGQTFNIMGDIWTIHTVLILG